MDLTEVFVYSKRTQFENFQTKARSIKMSLIPNSVLPRDSFALTNLFFKVFSYWRTLENCPPSTHKRHWERNPTEGRGHRKQEEEGKESVHAAGTLHSQRYRESTKKQVRMETEQEESIFKLYKFCLNTWEPALYPWKPLATAFITLESEAKQPIKWTFPSTYSLCQLSELPATGQRWAEVPGSIH